MTINMFSLDNIFLWYSIVINTLLRYRGSCPIWRTLNVMQRSRKKNDIKVTGIINWCMWHTFILFFFILRPTPDHVCTQLIKTDTYVDNVWFFKEILDDNALVSCRLQMEIYI